MEHRPLTANQAAEYLQVTSRWIRRILREGRLKGVKMGGGKLWRIKREDLDDYVESRGK